jgi:hypothetical protein
LGTVWRVAAVVTIGKLPPVRFVSPLFAERARLYLKFGIKRAMEHRVEQVVQTMTADGLFRLQFTDFGHPLGELVLEREGRNWNIHRLYVSCRDILENRSCLIAQV